MHSPEGRRRRRLHEQVPVRPPRGYRRAALV